MSTTLVRHPAKFSPTILSALSELLAEETERQGRRLTVLDPFAGTGRVHSLEAETWGVEIEPEWATLHPRTIVGNALALPFVSDSFDVIATSPTYGNRMADHHNAKDSSRRNTYRHTLGRALHPENSGQLQWGPRYCRFHADAWAEVHRVLRPGGLFLLNVSDHVRAGKVENVTGWHYDTLHGVFDFEIEREIQVATPRNRFGQNGAARVEHEVVFAARKAA